MKVTFKKLLLDKEYRILKKLPLILDMDMLKSFQQNTEVVELNYVNSEEKEDSVNITVKWSDGESEQFNLVYDDVKSLYELLDTMFNNIYNNELINEEDYEDAEEENEEELLDGVQLEFPFPESSNKGEVKE